jgi:hypothetical protein
LLLRDLRRPSWLAFPWHTGWYGRHYSGKMYELFKASVAAAYTGDELRKMAEQVPALKKARLFHLRRSHIGLEMRANG